MDHPKDPGAKPILLCLASRGRLSAWQARLAPLDAFVLVEARETGAAADLAARCRADLLILDAETAGDLPGDVLASFSAGRLGRVPVVILQEGGGSGCPDGLSGLRIEAVVGPSMSAVETAIRLRAVLRRRRPTALVTTLAFECLAVDQGRRRALVRGQAVDLPVDEFNLLALLLEAPDRLWTRSDLRSFLWPPQAKVGDAAVNKIVQGLRRSLQARVGRAPIESVRGVGYRLVPNLGTTAAA